MWELTNQSFPYAKQGRELEPYIACKLIAQLDIAVYYQILKVKILFNSYNYKTSCKKYYDYMLEKYTKSILDIYKDTIDIVKKGIGRNNWHATHII